MELLSHSAQGCVSEQFYREHVLAVQQGAETHIVDALHFFSGSCKEKSALLKAVKEGAVFHDLGKADPKNQAVLNEPDSRGRLPLNHTDAGSAFLQKREAFNGAVLVYCHHAGLFSSSDELKKADGHLAFRDIEIVDEVDAKLDGYITKHIEKIGDHDAVGDNFPLKGLSLRIALSCLVDADHHDTASHYGREPELEKFATRWEERLVALNKYVGELSQSMKVARNRLRQDIFKACLNAQLEPAIKCCDAPVGSGKTTAVIAHLLQIATKNNLRHIFIVLPYTNIIKQSVDVYRKALVLPGEDPEKIVAAHYHQADFSDLNSRHLSTLWRSPIIVTSAVQFFETLAGASTSKLRKLHELPGSAVFVDESHSTMPLHIWSQQWEWINELANKWCNHFVLASGSLVRFWEFDDFSVEKRSVPNILPEHLQERANRSELLRVEYPKRPLPMDRHDLASFIVSKPGPRLVILNTVQAAAVVANELRNAGHDTLHLSTALAPVDRDVLIARIHRRFEFRDQSDWTLVATSCVEAGVDFSFKTAFRESSTVTSLIQTGGRTNRHGRDEGCLVIDFRTRDPLLNKHPAFEISRNVVEQMFEDGLMNQLSPAELATESIRNEFLTRDVKKRIFEIRNAELQQEYKKVASLCRIIDADTRIVVVTPSIVKRLNNHETISSIELLRNSVQLWSAKILKLGLESLPYNENLYALGGYIYDPDFLGYMRGLLPLVYQHEESLII